MIKGETDMDGTRIREYFTNEIQSLVKVYRQFEILLPNQKPKRNSEEIKKGSSHKPEEGRYVEYLLKEIIKRFLPKDLEVLTGFILKPAVKIGEKDYSRKENNDIHSTQIDIIVYDSAHFPIFQRFENNVIVPPEGVIAALSVKKNLNHQNIKEEINSLIKVSKICRSENENIGPFLGLLSFESNIKDGKHTKNYESIYKALNKTYRVQADELKFDDVIGYIGAISEWSIFKGRPDKEGKKARFLFSEHSKENEKHLGIQLIINSILRIYYDSSRNTIQRPGFTAFPSNMIKSSEHVLGEIVCNGFR